MFSLNHCKWKYNAPVIILTLSSLCVKSLYSWVSIMMGIWAEWPGFVSWQGQEMFLYCTASRPALGLTQPSIQWLPGALSLGIKQLQCEVDHCHLVKGREWWSYTSTHPYVFMAWCLSKHRNNFTPPPPNVCIVLDWLWVGQQLWMETFYNFISCTHSEPGQLSEYSN
jgi:hypothetical protein